MSQLLKRLYRPKHMVRGELIKGELPTTRDGYSTAFIVATPAIIETFLIALIGVADTVTISGLSYEAIAAVSIVNQPRYMAQTLIFALNIAVSSICSRRKGAQDQQGATSALKQGLILSTILSVILSAIFYPLARNIVSFMDAGPEIIDHSTRYFQILILGLPLANLNHTISSAQRGIGETKASMRINMAANIVNIVFDILLIYGVGPFPRLEINGGAISTVLGWAVGLVIGIVSISQREQYLYVYEKEGWRFDKDTLKVFRRIGGGAFIEQACIRFGFIMNAKIVNGLDTAMIAAHEILTGIMSLSFSFGDGFGITASSLVGQNLGAKRPDLSIVYGKICQRMSLISSAVLSVFFAIFGVKIVQLLSQGQSEIMTVSRPILIIMTLIVFAQSSQMVFMGALRGAGDTKYTAIVSLLSIVILRPVLGYSLTYTAGFGLIGAWIGMVADQLLRLFLTHRRFSSGKWTTIEIK